MLLPYSGQRPPPISSCNFFMNSFSISSCLFLASSIFISALSFSISVIHMGVRELMKAAAGELAHLPPVITYEPEYVERPPEVDTSTPLTITHEDDVWMVDGPWLQKIMANVNFSNYESRNWFDRMLRTAGVFDRLEEPT